MPGLQLVPEQVWGVGLCAQAWLVRQAVRYQKEALQFTDERSKLEGELLNGIDVVKCNSWEVRPQRPWKHPCWAAMVQRIGCSIATASPWSVHQPSDERCIPEESRASSPVARVQRGFSQCQTTLCARAARAQWSMWEGIQAARSHGAGFLRCWVPTTILLMVLLLRAVVHVGPHQAVRYAGG